VKKERLSGLKGIFPPPLFVLALVITGATVQWYYPLSVPISFHRYLLLPGFFLIIISGLLAFQARRIMRSHQTPIDFREPTTVILHKGPFSFTRNPLYLSLLILYAGIGLTANSMWFIPLLVILFLFLHRVVLREEKYLEYVFGDKYVIYKGTVRRWL